MKNKIYYFLVLGAFVGTVSCKKQLDVLNPNAPTFAGNVNNEAGIISLAQGGVYINGFQNGDGWLGDSYFSLPYGYNELLGDVVGADAANQLTSQVNVPDYFILDNGTKVINPSPTRGLLRSFNTRAQTANGYNPFYYQWLNMYAMNNACNITLDIVGTIPFSGDATTKANTIKAWCYWWKGYAYASIGSMYYSGLIIDAAGTKSNKYVLHDAVIARSNFYFTEAANILNGITSLNDYTTVLGQLIPKITQTGNGGVLTPQMWIRNINTMMARNLVLNKLSPFVNGNPAASITGSSMPVMTAADWTNVLTLATNGIKNGDFVFTGRSSSVNGFFSTAGGSVAALTTGNNTGNTFKISERFIQNFKTGDKRLANNFVSQPVFTNNLVFGTRWNQVDNGKAMSGVYVYGTNTKVGAYELFIAGSYEENTLMLAEANIRLGKTDAGLAFVDAVRNYQGAGIAATANTGLTLSQAVGELVRERRVALVYRGISFYDNRRYGWIYDISKGGGLYGANVLVGSSNLNTNVTINYNFLDYWDVPADEIALNPADASSAPVINPN
ncbi:MAG: hypothetical protein M3040_02975 [Bacteroidota bacterium]|nr:hypothetical protein [Bacteroidota bacterium]